MKNKFKLLATVSTMALGLALAACDNSTSVVENNSVEVTENTSVRDNNAANEKED